MNKHRAQSEALVQTEGSSSQAMGKNGSGGRLFLLNDPPQPLCPVRSELGGAGARGQEPQQSRARRRGRGGAAAEERVEGESNASDRGTGGRQESRRRPGKAHANRWETPLPRSFCPLHPFDRPFCNETDSSGEKRRYATLHSREMWTRSRRIRERQKAQTKLNWKG